jgi:inosose dehydratase
MPQAPHIATNQYPWAMFFRREGRNLDDDLPACLREVSDSGLNGFEPLVSSLGQLDALAGLLGQAGLEMRSIYVGTELHEPGQAPRSIDFVLAVAEKAKALGTRIIVTNPNTLPREAAAGGSIPADKNDAQLQSQARALDSLGRQLAEAGLTLAYHNHDAELRQAAREFHHMMLATDPAHVTLCLDAHWIFRGAGNSALAVHDIVKLYGRRVSELHLRQSAGGVWCETFGEGDIDYARIARALAAMSVRPHLVLEQAVEKASPATMSAVQAHRTSVQNARRILKALTE